MHHKPKSLRLLLLLVAIILTSQVLGTANHTHEILLYLFTAIIFASGITILFKKLDLLSIILNIIIVVVIIGFFLVRPALWPLYLFYLFYDFLCILLCTLKLKLKIN